jgi:hypothetical protein
MRNRILFISLAVMLAISVGLIGCEGEVEPELEFMIYEVNPVTVLPADVQNLALTLFALNETPALNQTPELYYIDVGSLHLECCKNSGSIWYADFSKLYCEQCKGDGDEFPPDEETAVVIAEGFLSDLGLLLVEFPFHDIFFGQCAVFNTGTNQTETTICHLDVMFSSRLPSCEQQETLPVYGPGAKIRVSIGDNEEIIGFHYVWREVEPLETTYPAITQDEAIEIFKENLGGEPEELEVKLGYYAESEFIEQDFLQPYYIFDGTVMIEEEEVPFKTQLIPATTFSPTATIVSPDNGAEFAEGTIINFTASVSGGEPPYDYTWESNIDGVIGTGASFSSNLSVGQRDGRVLPHTIKLNVKDQNDNQSIDLVSIKVTPSSPMGSVPEGIQTLSTGSPADDTNDKEVGIEWVNDYTVNPLYNNDLNARGFRDELVADGWYPSFDCYDWWAWEEDFKFRNAPEGGTDFEWIDAVDFAFFSGHGYSIYIRFESSVDDYKFYFEDARWGGDAEGTPGEEGDLEWIVLDSCLALKWYSWHTSSYVFDRWDQAFDGLHYVLGFDTECGDDSDRGRIFAQYMKQGWTIRLAWIRATQATEYWAWGAYLRAERFNPLTNTYEDHLPDHGYISPDPYPVDCLVYCRWPCGPDD